MTRYLLAMSVGPVQGFIAQARRTRDLWFGSELLCQLSRCIAERLESHQARLLFPAVEQLPARKGRDRSPGVANKVLAIMPGEPRSAVVSARTATHELLREHWKKITHRDEVASLLHAKAEASAREQLDTFLELYAAWAPWEEGKPYHEVLAEVEQALAARKSLHAFAPWKEQQNGLHKSSLDGARESVLRRPEERTGPGWKAYRIGAREELDAMGLLKRTWHPPGQFVPVPSIGLADWVEHAQATQPELLGRLRLHCEDNSKHFTPVRREAPWVKAFPFDAQVLLPDRWRPYLEDVGLKAEDAPRFGREYVLPLLRAMRSEPYPFVTCLVADGDRMGETLQSLARLQEGPERHQRLSRALSDFSYQALSLVESEHRGVLVYAGGDDVLAFICLPDALACAQALHEAFAEHVGPALEGTGVAPPTLSVGLGVGHVMESMGDLLALGHRAERVAKAPDRNGLAVLLSKRGGQERTWRCRWDRVPRPQERLDEDTSLLEQEVLTLGKVHEVEALLERLPGPRAQPGERWGELLSAEVERILRRTGLGTATAKPGLDKVGPQLTGSYEERRQQVREWVDRLLVAEELSRARRHRHQGLKGERT